MADLPFTDVELGDILSLPDGRAVTARGRAMLPEPVGPLAGFVVVGELEGVLGIPAHPRGSLLVYQQVKGLPVPLERWRTACEGALRYFPPHLPGVPTALGELIYRVVEIRGWVDPVICLWRGSELVLFARAHTINPHEVRVLHAARPAEQEQEVARYAAVIGVDAPVEVAQPARRSLISRIAR